MTKQWPGWQQPHGYQPRSTAQTPQSTAYVQPSYAPHASSAERGRPTAAYRRPESAGPPRRPRRRRWVFVVVVVDLILVLAVGGYLALVYYSSVGAPPSAEPMPEQCAVSAELLARAGTPSWQSGPLRINGDVQGVSCQWVAGEDEHVRQRRLVANVDRYPSASAAKKGLAERVAAAGALGKQDEIGAEAFVRAANGTAVLLARQGRTVIDVEFGGSNKTLLSGVFGDSPKNAVPASQLRELIVAVSAELIADAQ